MTSGEVSVNVTVSLTGNHHRLDFLIGEGKALDPARYFIVCVDPIGNGLSSSPSNSEKQPRMPFGSPAIPVSVTAATVASPMDTAGLPTW